MRLAASMTLFLPGSGHLLLRDWSWGVFYLVMMGFLASLGWAIVATLDRLVQTLPFLGLPPVAAFWGLAGVCGVAAMLHVCGVIHALGDVGDEVLDPAPHPAVSGFASLLVPGWGQILNGTPTRAAPLLGTAWVFAAAAVLMSAPGIRLLASVGLGIPDAINTGWATPVLLAVPATVWAIGLYDAIATAKAQRR